MWVHLDKNNSLRVLRLLIEYIFKVFVFLIPSQLAIHLWPKWAYIYGIRIDYFSPTIFLTDILVFLILILWLISLLISKKRINISKINIFPILLFIFVILF